MVKPQMEVGECSRTGVDDGVWAKLGIILERHFSPTPLYLFFAFFFCCLWLIFFRFIVPTDSRYPDIWITSGGTVIHSQVTCCSADMHSWCMIVKVADSGEAEIKNTRFSARFLLF